jgi:hypothetical protein
LYSGRSNRTRSLSTVIDRCHPIRSAITVVGISGNSFSSSLICGSTASTIDPLLLRRYVGGSLDANAFRTVFRAIPRCRAIALIGIPSARRNRRISAQSSTLITLQRVEGVKVRAPSGGHSSAAADTVACDPPS